VRTHQIAVGTCGWQYRDWRDVVYPPGVPPHSWLTWYSRVFPVVEVDATFYRLPTPSVVAGWSDQTPDGFRFLIKASRYLTHIRRLQQPSEPVQRLLERVQSLGSKLAGVLLQLPPSLPADPDLLAQTLSAFDGVRVAVEPRHASWWCDDVAAVLRETGAATVWADRRSTLLGPMWHTAPWGYIRLHEGRASPAPRYGSTALRTWRHRLEVAAPRWSDAFLLFNNDSGGAAFFNARTMARELGASDDLSLGV
jgi:uncharacterized protein YecE (DUF72 family)